jgi:uncharacterized membrane-anchored protein
MGNSFQTIILPYLRLVGQSALSVWFISWAIRKRNGIECRLTKVENIIRWTAVLFCFSLGLLQGQEFAAIRVISGLIGLCFVALPNLAHYLARLFIKK